MKIILEPFNQQWKEWYLTEAATIQHALQNMNPHIEHIGSTSVDGLAAKPIVDILVGLDNEADLNKAIAPMIASGYTYIKKFEPEWPTRRLFVNLKPGESVLIPQLIDVGDDLVIGKHLISKTNIHIILKSSSDWVRHLAFRDFLKAHPDVKQEYQQIKLALVKRNFESMQEYNNGKNDFIKRTEIKALQWMKFH